MTETLALRNVLALAAQLKRRVQRGGVVQASDLDHFLRFCAEAGVTVSVLRGESTLKPCPSCGQQEPVGLTHGHGWGKNQELTGHRIRCDEFSGGCGMSGPLAYSPDDSNSDPSEAEQLASQMWNALPRTS